MQFKNYFSKQADVYARSRPRYPASLAAVLTGLVERRVLAWDVATGNGQLAVGLAEHFEAVIATDASARQIASATAHPRVRYAVSLAEDSKLPPASADLITVAQAVHWFDLERFYAEVRRVAAPGAVLVLVGYGPFLLDGFPAAVRGALEAYMAAVEMFWPPERQLIDSEYRTVDFPFAEIPLTVAPLEERWTNERMLGYLRSWSATQRYIEAKGPDSLLALAEELADAWGESLYNVRWPLFLRAGRID